MNCRKCSDSGLVVGPVILHRPAARMSAGVAANTGGFTPSSFFTQPTRTYLYCSCAQGVGRRNRALQQLAKVVDKSRLIDAAPGTLSQAVSS